MEVFLSRPTWVADEFSEGLRTFETQLSNLDLAPRTLGVSDYPSKSPLDEVIELMKECRGAIILGIPQIQITEAQIKGQLISQPVELGTEWNHLEAGLAHAAGLPLLVIHHSTISRGIFDRGVLNAFLHSEDLTTSNWSMQKHINGALTGWKRRCISGPLPATTSENVQPGKPICPNCSTNQKNIYLSPLPRQFRRIAGGSWRCSICNYVE